MNERIIDIVCNYYGVSRKKSEKISKVWGFCAFFIRRHCGYSLRKTGRLVGKSYVSVKQAEDKINFDIRHYEDMRREFEEIEDLILEYAGLVPRKETFNELLDKSVDDGEEKYKWRTQYQTGKKIKGL